ncbi:MAG: acylphosphatase [Methanothrix sp.]|jgi:acylphosphatase|nr:acylphosphatase [Methanothrix sp.]
MKRLIAHVSGKVKGVGYSSIVVTLARTLDLKGYVEILPDGKAFIIAEGPKVDLAKFVRAIRIDNAKIRVEGILIDCREATGEFGDFHKILPRQEMQLQPFREHKKTEIDKFRQSPEGLEREDPEICRTNHKLKRAGSGLERQEDAIELSQEETQVPGSCRPLPKLQKKAIFK